MRLNFTLFSLLLFSYTAGAQHLTGIWRGYFSSTNGMYRDGAKEELYKYEIQIEQLANNSLKGVTYSYRTTVFYGKATLQGIFTAQTKTLIIKETGLLEVKIQEKSEPCLMTCYLDYSKVGKLEVLQGTFISVNIKDKGDCGSGKVYLEKVPTTAFEKESFLLKKKDSPVVKRNPAIVKTPGQIPIDTPKAKALPPPATNTKPGGRPSATARQKPLVAKPNTPVQQQRPPATKPANQWVPDATISSRKTDSLAVLKKEKLNHKGPIPKVLLERENNLIKTIYTSEQFLQVDIYDNGTIDNDTISLYHNNRQVISHGRLNYAPLSLKIKCDSDDNRHELILVAENLGEIPPNTALMVITAGKKRYEVFLTSNEQRNAKIVIEYTPAN